MERKEEEEEGRRRKKEFILSGDRDDGCPAVLTAADALETRHLRPGGAHLYSLCVIGLRQAASRALHSLAAIDRSESLEDG